jgi:hypothetical protein
VRRNVCASAASSSADVMGSDQASHLREHSQPFPPGLFHRSSPLSPAHSLPPVLLSAHPLPPVSLLRSQPPDGYGSLGRVSAMDDVTRCGASDPSCNVRAPLLAERATRLDAPRARDGRGYRGELEREMAQLHSSLGSVGMYSVNEHDDPPMPQKPPGKGGWVTTTTTRQSARDARADSRAFSKHSVSAGCTQRTLRCPIW